MNTYTVILFMPEDAIPQEGYRTVTVEVFAFTQHGAEDAALAHIRNTGLPGIMRSQWRADDFSVCAVLTGHGILIHGDTILYTAES